MMRFRTSFLFCFVLAFAGTGACEASIQITAVYRGVTVDGVTNSNTTTGAYSTSLINTNEFGTSSASIDSSIVGNVLAINGEAWTAAVSNEVFSPVIRSRVFFNVAFTIDQPYDFNMAGTLVGQTETEGAHSKASLIGPGTNLSFMAGSGQLEEVNQFGTLSPGDYTLAVEAYPIVLGGLDGGWAFAYIHQPYWVGEGEAFNLTLIPLSGSGGTEPVPELSTLATWAILCPLGLALLRARRQRGYCPATGR